MRSIFLFLILILQFSLANAVGLNKSQIGVGRVSLEITEFPNVSLSLDKKDSRLDYLNFGATLLTGLSSVVAIFMSGYVAYKSARFSKEIAERQIIQKEKELAQKDRELLKDISANRIKWMDDFTRAFSDYYGTVMWVRRLYLEKGVIEADMIDRIGSASAKVDLLLNPRDKYHLGIYELLDAINNNYLQSDHGTANVAIDKILSSATLLARFITRKEWIEAKKILDAHGELADEEDLYEVWCMEVHGFSDAWELAKSMNPSKFDI